MARLWAVVVMLRGASALRPARVEAPLPFFAPCARGLEAVLAAEDPAADQDGDSKKNERNFNRKDVEDFLDVLKRNHHAASVYAYNDFRYGGNNTI